MPGGRPSKYDSAFDHQVEKLCQLGATDKDLAAFFKVSEVTIGAWKKASPEFLSALKSGKNDADEAVKKSLFKRATGYGYPDTHFSTYNGKVTKTKYTKNVIPDTVACIFWLKNRDPDHWREKEEKEHNHKGKVTVGWEKASKDKPIAQ